MNRRIKSKWLIGIGIIFLFLTVDTFAQPQAALSVQSGTTVLESCVTMAYMVKHGWERVRGRSWTTVDMKKEPAVLARARHFAIIKNGEAQESVESPSMPDSRATSEV